MTIKPFNKLSFPSQVAIILLALVLGIVGTKLTTLKPHSDEIYAPIRVVCWDAATGQTIVDNQSFGGLTFGSGWFNTNDIIMDYTTTRHEAMRIDLSKARCAVAAYRDEQ